MQIHHVVKVSDIQSILPPSEGESVNSQTILNKLHEECTARKHWSSFRHTQHKAAPLDLVLNLCHWINEYCFQINLGFVYGILTDVDKFGCPPEEHHLPGHIFKCHTHTPIPYQAL
ncbi:hypothetical protein TNCV_3012331 [Trichonephila clavipes]|nr:hypothetical protein TNCV_3012331 [Trichonephila clavipes]